MKLDAQNILKLVGQGEGLTLEFKTCRAALNRDVYETVCAFLNRHGGTILLGVDDDGSVTGVDAGAVDQIRRDFANALNNPQKINPVAYLSINEVEVGGYWFTGLTAGDVATALARLELDGRVLRVPGVGFRRA